MATIDGILWMLKFGRPQKMEEWANRWRIFSGAKNSVDEAARRHFSTQ
jgi:hypothetical protein